MTPERWPALPYDDWKDTYATLHMWSQIVGKIARARIRRRLAVFCTSSAS